MPSEDLSPSSYDGWRQDFARERLRTLYYLGFTANPVFLLSDFLFYRDQWPILLTLRVLLQTGHLIMFLAFVRRRTAVHPRVPLIAWVIIANVCLAHMTVTLGGFSSPYYSGLNLVLLAAAVIVPVSWPSHVSAQIATLVYYYGINVLSHQSAGAESAALQNSFFLIWTCIACLFSVYLYESLQAAEFQARLSERRAREELEQSHRKLLELDRLKDQFFANINHELRTPLTLSLGAFKALLKLPLVTEAHVVVQSGLRNTSRLLFLINELLELARFESGRADLRPVCVDLAALIRNVAANFESSEWRRVCFDDPPAPVPAQVDVRKMTKVLSNLLMNAFKFSDPEKGKVWISLASDPTHALITIRDNGIGIAEDQLNRIFDRFTQVEGQATRRFEGSGIGLALAREIVTLHGGQIAVQSIVGEGSTFTITLPRGEVDSHPLTSLDEEDTVVPLKSEGTRPSLEEVATIRDAAIADRPLILIADDNADMRAYLVRLLADEYRVISAYDGADALEKTRRAAPSLVVTDIMMPVMSGHDLLKAIRCDDALRTIPVILLTARAGTEARVESLEAGADDYVSKPFNEEELHARIKNQLRIHRQEQELEAKATQLQELYSQLEGTNAELRKLSLRKSELVSIVSHDLRTPLAAIDGFVENLMDEIAGPLTDKQRRYLDRIKNNIGRLVRMINDLLDLSKIEAGTLRLELKPFAIAELVETVAENLRGLAKKKGISLPGISVEKSLLIRGDPDRLTQVLTNLIQNACKFTPAGGEVRLEVMTDEPGFASVCVADTGCGIPLAEAARVFEKFYRGTASHGEARGAGLGLAIAKHLVELHQGRIWVDSTPGQGSRFCFTIPLAAQEADRR
ncbi:MAG TPA: ATP-binding protein [Nitrospiraceae bacterium]|nr:ATP-binding protein [Nitrospiraceae bacterium]